jgi:type II secretory pathway pseudopilin PulG
MINKVKNIRDNKKGSTLVELMIVVVLIVVLIPSAVNMFISARKINGQAYIQHQGAVTLGETTDILRYLRNQGFSLLVNGSFYLIRNPGSSSWLVKSDLPNIDTYERYITVSDALRHQDTKNLYLTGDTGTSYSDPDTKKIVMQIIWSPSFLSLNLISQTVYITNWEKVITY